MGLVGTLSVSLTAKTKDFTKGIKRARRSLKKFGSMIPGLNANVGRLAAVAGAAAVGGLALLTKQSMATIDATAKMADRLNISVENLTAFQLSAELAGSSTEGVNKSIEQFVRRIGEAKQGTGTAKVALDQMGLSAKKLSEMDTAKAMGIIGDKLNDIPNAADRAALAYELFGRKGVELTQFLLQGTEGMKAARDEADKLGVTFNRVDAAKVEAANDAISRFKKSLTGIGNAIAIELAGPLRKAAKQASDFVSDMKIKAIVKQGFKFVVLTTAKIMDAIQGARAAWNLFQGSLQMGTGLIIKALAEAIELFEDLQRVLGKPITSSLSDTTKIIAKGLIEDGGKNIEEGKKQLADFMDAFNVSKATAWFNNLKLGFKDLKDNLTGRKKDLKDFGKDLASEEGPLAGGDDKGAGGRRGAARQFRAGGFAVAGISANDKNKVQQVNDPENKKIVKEIGKMRRDMAGGAVAK